MASLVVFTDRSGGSAAVLPALALLGHTVRVVPADARSALTAPEADLWLLDARRNLVNARSLCRVLAESAQCPLLLVVEPDALAALTPEWGFADFLLSTVGPGELEARMRLRLSRDDDDAGVVTVGGIEIDDGSYTAQLHGQPLDLTYTEFELLKFLVQHPGRAFTRQQLLSDVWGYDYFGGTRTVDVHVRRLRAKLGPEHEMLIQTVRNVGYRLVPVSPQLVGDDGSDEPDASATGDEPDLTAAGRAG